MGSSPLWRLLSVLPSPATQGPPGAEACMDTCRNVARLFTHLYPPDESTMHMASMLSAESAAYRSVQQVLVEAAAKLSWSAQRLQQQLQLESMDDQQDAELCEAAEQQQQGWLEVACACFVLLHLAFVVAAQEGPCGQGGGVCVSRMLTAWLAGGLAGAMSAVLQHMDDSECLVEMIQAVGPFCVLACGTALLAREFYSFVRMHTHKPLNFLYSNPPPPSQKEWVQAHAASRLTSAIHGSLLAMARPSTDPHNPLRPLLEQSPLGPLLLTWRLLYGRHVGDLPCQPGAPGGKQPVEELLTVLLNLLPPPSCTGSIPRFLSDLKAASQSVQDLALHCLHGRLRGTACAGAFQKHALPLLLDLGVLQQQQLRGPDELAQELIAEEEQAAAAAAHRAGSKAAKRQRQKEKQRQVAVSAAVPAAVPAAAAAVAVGAAAGAAAATDSPAAAGTPAAAPVVHAAAETREAASSSGSSSSSRAPLQSPSSADGVGVAAAAAAATGTAAAAAAAGSSAQEAAPTDVGQQAKQGGRRGSKHRRKQQGGEQAHPAAAAPQPSGTSAAAAAAAAAAIYPGAAPLAAAAAAGEDEDESLESLLAALGVGCSERPPAAAAAAGEPAAAVAALRPGAVESRSSATASGSGGHSNPPPPQQPWQQVNRTQRQAPPVGREPPPAPAAAVTSPPAAAAAAAAAVAPLPAGDGLEGFYCPITTELIRDPVMAADGFTYERTAIEQWMQQRPSCAGATSGVVRSPMSNEPLPTTMLFPNHTLRAVIAEYRQRHGMA